MMCKFPQHMQGRKVKKRFKSHTNTILSAFIQIFIIELRNELQHTEKLNGYYRKTNQLNFPFITYKSLYTHSPQI